jgi:predicted alpha/beta-hydrolase family hydrolase
MPAVETFSDTTHENAAVRGYLHRAKDPEADCLILTHGAGANCQAPLLRALADAFCAAGMTVLRCDLPFRQARPTGPPPRGAAERDQAGLRAAVEAMRRLNLRHVFLGGHSYGGRQASMLAAKDSQIADALLLLSYPLHPPKQPEKLRTEHFPSLQVPALFVHGVRDGFATDTEMEQALSLIPARTEMISISGAGHELMSKSNRDVLLEQVTSRFAAFTHPTA